MSRAYFDYAEIKTHGNCLDYVRTTLGQEVRGDRCQALWRGGDGFNVALQQDQWYDHVEQKGGSILDLCAAAEFNGDILQAQERLGILYGLKGVDLMKPDPQKKQSRYDQLISEGWVDIAHYNYTDVNGNDVHSVVRLEKNGDKTFLQRTPETWGMKGTDPVLYNLPLIVPAPAVAIVEGEKDADRLSQKGIPTTTVCGGAKKWRPEYDEVFRGKEVVILPDNDEPGQEHGKMIAARLLPIAKTVRIAMSSTAPKGDIGDWLDEDPTRGYNEICVLLNSAPILTPEDFTKDDLDPVVQAAKDANVEPFRNFFIEEVPLPNGTVKLVKKPRQINEMAEECRIRFLDFPRKIGDQLFDHDRDTHEIHYIDKSPGLFAWMMEKSENLVEWARIEGATSREEFLSIITAQAIAYDGISMVPDYPTNDRVYYAHDPLPEPSDDHRFFHRLVDFFNPASPADLIFLRCFIMAPLYYREGIHRPSWIIDSEDGSGTGKTSLVEMVALLYNAPPIRTSPRELQQQITEVIKRIMSSAGRRAKTLLIDNVTGTFRCQQLADLITADHISGRPAYGKGEETRPNNLTYAITANSAAVDNDIAVRSFYIELKRTAGSTRWRSDVRAYIKTHQLQIFADMIDILETAAQFPDVTPSTRFPEFETEVLQANCPTMDDYEDAIRSLADIKSEANIEEEMGRQIEETFRYELIDLGLNPDEDRVFIRTEIAEKWLEKALTDRQRDQYQTGVQIIRNLAKQGALPQVQSKTKRYPTNGTDRRSGIMWGSGRNPVEVVGKGREGQPEILA